MTIFINCQSLNCSLIWCLSDLAFWNQDLLLSVMLLLHSKILEKALEEIKNFLYPRGKWRGRGAANTTKPLNTIEEEIAARSGKHAKYGFWIWLITTNASKYYFLNTCDGLRFQLKQTDRKPGLNIHHTLGLVSSCSFNPQSEQLTVSRFTLLYIKYCELTLKKRQFWSHKEPWL